MDILFSNNKICIKSYDFSSGLSDEMIDFFILYGENEYSCSAFTLNYIQKYLTDPNKYNYFWSISSIIIRDFTKESLIKAILEIIEDPTMDINSMFIKTTPHHL